MIRGHTMFYSSEAQALRAFYSSCDFAMELYRPRYSKRAR